MSSLVVRASGECSIQQVQFKHENIHNLSSKTPQTQGGPENNQHIIRSQRDVSIGSNRAVNQAVDQALNISKTLSGCKH